MAHKDRREYYKQYRKDKKQDEEWIIFQRAISYLVKANKPYDKHNGHNCIKDPSEYAIKKYELYKHKGLWYSSLVDRYCMTYQNCKRN